MREITELVRTRETTGECRRLGQGDGTGDAGNCSPVKGWHVADVNSETMIMATDDQVRVTSCEKWQNLAVK